MDDLAAHQASYRIQQSLLGNAWLSDRRAASARYCLAFALYLAISSTRYQG